MTLRRSIACVVMMVAILSGCERDDDATTGGTASGTGTGTGTGAGTGVTAGTTSDSATAGSSAAAPTPAATPDASSAAAAAQTAATSDAPTTAPSAADTTQAQKLLDQTVTYIKENKMDLAEKSLTQLEQLKPKLPVEYHSKIDGARKAFNAAKTGQGLKLDGLLPGSAK